MEMQDMLLQDYLLHLVGPSRVGHTGRVPPESSPGGRKGSLGWKNTSPSILARPGWRGRRRRGGRQWARSSSQAGQWLTVTCRLSQKEYIVRLSMTRLDLLLPKMSFRWQKTFPFSTSEVIIFDHVKHYLGFTIMDYASWTKLSREKLLFFETMKIYLSVVQYRGAHRQSQEDGEQSTRGSRCWGPWAGKCPN